MQQYFLRLWAAVALIVALAACGGGGASLTAPAGLAAVPDAATLAWNSSASVDVLANDRLGGGTAVVASVTAPAHGTAVISGGKIVYTPQAGFFGEDRLTYTARVAPGGSESSAELRLTVTATLRLQGRVGHAAMAGASVAVSVGAQTVAATADVAGAFTAEFTTANPSDMVSLVATGPGANAQVKLTSLAGDTGTLARWADARGVATAERVPVLNVSPLSSALAALVVQAYGGVPPGDAATLQALTFGQPPQRVTDLATVITLVADKILPMPEGVADTLTLIRQPPSHELKAFIQAAADLSMADQDLYNAAVLSATSNSAASGVPGLTSAGPEERAYVGAFRATRTNGALFISYRPDGTATVTTGRGSSAATWAVSGGVVRLALAQAQTIDWYDIDPVSLVTTQYRDEVTGLELRQFAGTEASGMVVWTATGKTTTLDGPRAGTVAPIAPFGTVLSVQNLRAMAAPLAATEFTAGSRWAGVLLDPTFDSFSAGADTLEILGAGTARLMRTGASASWSVSDGWLRVVQGPLDRRYFRLSRDTASGEEHWLVADFGAAGIVQVNEALVVKAVAERFEASSALYRVWINGVSDLAIAWSSSSFEFFAGGKGRLNNSLEARPGSSFNASWSIGTDGSFGIASLNAGGEVLYQRTWQLLRRTATQLFVMEHLMLSSGDIWRVNVYSDTGPSQP